MRLLVTLSFLLALALPAFAQDDLAQRRTVAHELVQITTADAVMTPMVDAIWPTLEAQITAGSPNADKAVLAALKDAFAAELLSTMADVVDDFAGLYANAFTLDELNAIVAFYRSGPGSKLIAEQPKVMDEMLPKLTAKLQTSLPLAMQKVMEQAQQQGLKTGN